MPLIDGVSTRASRRDDLLVEDVIIQRVVDIAIDRLDLALELEEYRDVDCRGTQHLKLRAQAIDRLVFRGLELLLLLYGCKRSGRERDADTGSAGPVQVNARPGVPICPCLTIPFIRVTRERDDTLISLHWELVFYTTQLR